MLLTYGDVSKLVGQKWYCLELCSEKTAEAILHRLATAMPSLCKKQALEVFVPVGDRDLGLFEMRAGEYVFVRALDKKLLLRLRRVVGVVGLMTRDSSPFSRKIIPLDDDYVQGLIKEAEQRFYSHCKGVKLGSFVRILNGHERGYCGHVTAQQGDRVTVLVELRTKAVIISTPRVNVKNMDFVPKAQQVFYYTPLLGEIADLTLLTTLPDDPILDSAEEPAAKVRLPRNNTATSYVRKRIQDGQHNMADLLDDVMKRFQQGAIRLPKNTRILHGLMKSELLKVFAPLGLSRQEIKKRFLTPREVVAVLLTHDIDLPMNTPESELKSYRHPEGWVRKLTRIPKHLQKKRGRPRKVSNK